MLLDILFIHFLLYMNPEIGFKVVKITNDCFVFNSNSLVKSCNRVFHNLLPTDTDILKIKTYFGELPFTWLVNSNDTESQKILEKNNLKYKLSVTHMVADLNNLEFDNNNQVLNINLIDLNNHDLESWLKIVSESFNVPIVELRKVINVFKNDLIPNSLNLYLGLYEKKPIVAGMAIKHNDIISLHWICSLLEFRKKGFASALTKKILLESKNVGCKKAVLLSSDDGKSIYKKLAFKECSIYKIYGNY